ncbi:MAG: helix-turn-helix transcriptional regulator [Acidimicrobiia bacterium]
MLAMVENPTTWRYGYELCQMLDLKAGSLYPILMRLDDRGMLEAVWEKDAPVGRPPRHLYRLTGPGLALAAEHSGAATQTAAPPRLQARGEAP